MRRITRRVFGFLLTFALFASCQQFETESVDSRSTKLDLQTRSVLVPSEPLVVGYFPSWSESTPNGTSAGSNLRDLPEEVTHVFLSFVKPNMRYTKGSFDLKGTGLEVPYSGDVLKTTMDILKGKGIKVILSIGGATYWDTNQAYDIDFAQIADFVRDFGFDGIDWDYEPNGGFEAIGQPENVERFIRMIKESRKLLPREEGFLITCAPAGCGALGRSTPYAANDDAESPYAYAKRVEVTGGPLSAEYNFTSDQGYTISLYGYTSTGHMIPVFKAAGYDLDFVALQAYNIGSASKREIMYDSYAYYANIYGFRVAFGMHVPDEPWGPHYTYTEEKVRQYTTYVASGGKHNRSGKGDGVMFWQLLQTSSINPALSGVDYCKISYNILSQNSGITVPSVRIASPVNNALIRQSQTIDFRANVKRTSRVELYVDNSLVATSTAEPFATTLKGLSLGFHTLKAVAFNQTNERAEVTVTIKIISDDSIEGIPAWSASTTYATPGSQVLYNNQVWRNKWWTQGDVPGRSDVWELVTLGAGTGSGSGSNTGGTGGDNTGGNTGGDTGNTGGNTGSGDTGNTGGSTGGNTGGGSTGGDTGNTGGTSGTIEQYDPSRTYPTAGTIVLYNGVKYRNKWWTNPGQTPADVNGPWERIYESGEGTTPDKAFVYDMKATYANPGTYVSYNGKIYKNKWYVSPGDYPGKTEWGPWVLVP